LSEQNVHDPSLSDSSKTGNVRLSGNQGDPILEIGLRKSDGTLDSAKGAVLLQPVTQIDPDHVAAGTPQTQLRHVGLDTNGKPCYLAATGTPTGLGAGVSWGIIAEIIPDDCVLVISPEGDTEATTVDVAFPPELQDAPAGNPDNPEPEIWPAYAIGDVIYYAPVSDTGLESVPNLDLNVDSRRWSYHLSICEPKDYTDLSKGYDTYTRRFHCGPRS
jgi:hypothetical protein